MKSTALVLASILSVAGVAAHAETPDPSGQFAHPVSSVATRAQVRAELLDAQRTGNILAGGDAGVTLAQQNPAAYPVVSDSGPKTREQVRQETLQALRNGDVIVGGDAGLTERQLNPQEYRGRDGSQRHQWFAARHF